MRISSLCSQIGVMECLPLLITKEKRGDNKGKQARHLKVVPPQQRRSRWKSETRAL
jgi:hypothetical protein